MKGQKVLAPLTYPLAKDKKRHATVIGRGTYKGGRQYVDVEFQGLFGKWRERFFEEDVKEVTR